MYNYLTYEVNVRLLFVRVEDYIYILEEEKMRKTIRQSATVWIFGLLLAMFGMLSGCINATDYTDCFSVQSISPGTDLAETLIEVKYKVRNTTKIDGLTFCVTVDDSSEECTLDHGNETSVTLLVDIGCPEDFNVSCMATYEVKRKKSQCICRKIQLLTIAPKCLFILLLSLMEIVR